MRFVIEVDDRAEGDRIALALRNDVVRVVANIVGILQPLGPERARRIMAHVAQHIVEQEEEEGRDAVAAEPRP